MKNVSLTFTSKTKKSLRNIFLIFIEQNHIFHNTQKVFQKKTKKCIVTLLKSPHVNKSAQEQFEIRIFSRHLNVYSSKKMRYLFFLKRLFQQNFSDFKFKAKFSIDKRFKFKPKLFILENLSYTNLQNQILQKSQRNEILSFQSFRSSINLNYVWRLKKRKFIRLNLKMKDFALFSYLKIFDLYGEIILLGFKY